MQDSLLFARVLFIRDRKIHDSDLMTKDISRRSNNSKIIFHKEFFYKRIKLIIMRKSSQNFSNIFAVS